MCAPVSVAVGGMGESLVPQSAAIVKLLIDGFVFFFGATIAWGSLNPLKKLKL